MINSIKDRALKEAEYYLKGHTIREIVKLMKKESINKDLIPSRVTVHSDLANRLKKI